ncbi:hypothetical protein EYF80_036005 [Liparis tanakae]|uniref:Uncharacterized protein n=1 Tax=Liparis tanakae TaxID=230148 RepID=A0A4Z2GKR3_9TELE|nr:hypothetical protein EYF80_036005 [Liparis tanakae]
MNYRGSGAQRDPAALCILGLGHSTEGKAAEKDPQGRGRRPLDPQSVFRYSGGVPCVNTLERLQTGMFPETDDGQK